MDRQDEQDGFERVRAWYRRFAEHYEAGGAGSYAEIARALAGDEEMVGRVLALPGDNKRQPHLLLGAVRFLGGPVDGWAVFRPWVVEHWDRVRAVVLERMTQTNEVRRCAALLPVLARLEGPLGLVEVGASAGLCLYPDRYAYSYDGAAPVGEGPVVLECATSGGVPVPERVVEVAWRAGVDLNPLDVCDERDVRWLESLIWPGAHEAERRERLRAAAAVVAAAGRPPIVAGDLLEVVADLVGRVPAGVTPVVFHGAVLTYLPLAERERFARLVEGLPGHWVSYEGWRVLPWIEGARPPVATDLTVAVDGRVVAWAGEHGQSLTWA
ncbi:DUF2332 domain-containing protein [Nocardiopsis changdeensis]|uniref:DUF2332 domain-containing protein n=1 Tax=Nocardiopsis changdeensis TaxID=2831969 RepID=A0ABX8BTK1_9ACTN|nr:MULTISPECIES: DUF2332 domain-containing protein [Nocardiopsis]QUX25404.1 DUF2332 domain-containing protein [Nocardiopsis changdeensis]QYX35789.1 DUF2332 domain-containing protein [Nocardiopsis sp. MT53]